MFKAEVHLPSELHKARVIGKNCRKLKDIESVSGAKLAVEGLKVKIIAEKKESLDMAVRMVDKSNKHLEASFKVPKPQQPQDTLLCEFKTAAYWTLKHANKD